MIKSKVQPDPWWKWTERKTVAFVMLTLATFIAGSMAASFWNEAMGFVVIAAGIILFLVFMTSCYAARRDKVDRALAGLEGAVLIRPTIQGWIALTNESIVSTSTSQDRIEIRLHAGMAFTAGKGFSLAAEQTVSKAKLPTKFLDEAPNRPWLYIPGDDQGILEFFRNVEERDRWVRILQGERPSGETNHVQLSRFSRFVKSEGWILVSLVVAFSLMLVAFMLHYTFKKDFNSAFIMMLGPIMNLIAVQFRTVRSNCLMLKLKIWQWEATGQYPAGQSAPSPFSEDMFVAFHPKESPSEIERIPYARIRRVWMRTTKPDLFTRDLFRPRNPNPTHAKVSVEIDGDPEPREYSLRFDEAQSWMASFRKVLPLSAVEG